MTGRPRRYAQLHYTSAPPGPDGSGFRFTAVSAGLPTTVLREAEQLIGYEPPRDAPARPTEEQLGSFPEALSLSLLSDGSRLLARSVYTGADYSGRWGNFHTHALHLPGPAGPADGADPAEAGPLPISAWRSPEWAAATPPGGAPEPLGALPAPGLLDLDGLYAFAARRSALLPGFFADLRRLAADPSAPQIVLVEADTTAIAHWVVLATGVLPPPQAHRLTFTTYTRRPQLARQQLVGVLPADAPALAGQEHRHRLYDGTRAGGGAGERAAEGGAAGERAAEGGAGASDAPATADVWAGTAARVWLARRPELFATAHAYAAGGPAGADPAGPLAALALAAGVALEPAGRAAAADWAADHPGALDGVRLAALAGALAAPGRTPGPDEAEACGRLLAALDGRAPRAVTEPLTAVVLSAAAGSGRVPAVLPSPGALGTEARQRLAGALGPRLRARIADAGRDPADRAGLLRIAALLGADCTDLLPDFARHLARALLAAPERTHTRAVRAALEEVPGLRTALLERLDPLAAGDPVAAARLSAAVPLRPADGDSVPHLRMCAEAPAVLRAAGDRVWAVQRLMTAGGVSPYAEPLVLRTAVRLVWGGGPPAAGEARLLLAETGKALHRTAGTWEALAAAALGAPVDDEDAPELAHELLRAFQELLPAGTRAALLLLELARDLRQRTAGGGWLRRALDLRAAAGEGLQPGVRDRAFTEVARRLLAEDRPEGELRALVDSEDAELLAAYRAEARGPLHAVRLRGSNGCVADCFVVWSAQPQAGPRWQETRTDLLEHVLRPVVRQLPPAGLAETEEHLERFGGRWAQDFRSWQRPGAFGRLRDRFGGRAGGDGLRWGGVRPPGDGGARGGRP
ncbi:GTPase-associated protein 1-related protein [Streptomyces sp. NPDC012888]|uniref:GTPase-associated protein 1-related protein n=1 Tax=Streptomyces sp. NPDC012888 TaxID=3364855 RepID=UPI0036A8279F